MPEMSTQEAFLSNYILLLNETFQGPDPLSGGSAFLDRNAGFAQTLGQLTAEQASTPAWPGATTVVAQVHHTKYYLDMLLAIVAGDRQPADWASSWTVTTATDDEWQSLKNGLLDAADAVREAALSQPSLGDDEIGGLLALLIHSAYHLGAVRQLVLGAAALAS